MIIFTFNASSKERMTFLVGSEEPGVWDIIERDALSLVCPPSRASEHDRFVKERRIKFSSEAAAIVGGL